ncbi:cation:proton antiporter domain-containing protein [Variovorax sp. HW608]|uniref:cation:proton antiporter domain-containing protein n=1 Tax=Variovorax sp. HW608 TaxID=1034889 RepID=UPI0022B2580A|nr:cation:proton antiporter [Variovorax sp. HW608]
MPLALLLLQLTVILIVARLSGQLLRAFGQPMVIGEMAAGMLLGPAVFGAMFPEGHAQLFPAASLPGLSSLAMIGVVLFMFIVGAELRSPGGMGAQLRAAGWVGLSSMALPMLLGLAIAPVLHPALAPAGVAFWPFALFLGVALSIAAFRCSRASSRTAA